MASILSPLASPFVPIERMHDGESIFKAIYNNGVPELVRFGNHSDHDIIHDIPDEAIDELFPPTASDAAELDAVDEFLRTMMYLSYLEEREEKARNGFSHVKKRWESRRQQGLIGKPRQVDTRHVTNAHGTSSMLRRDEKSVVKFGTNLTDLSVFDHKIKLREKSFSKHQSAPRSNNPRRCRGLHGHLRQQIQQPRKMN